MQMVNVFDDQKRRELAQYYCLREEARMERGPDCGCFLCLFYDEQIAALEAALREVPVNG